MMGELGRARLGGRSQAELHVTLGLADLAGGYVNLRCPPTTADHRRARTKG